ncbi:MAG TPA: DUF4160 domain-containing protein [Chitinophagales bacterium]|nr:DUF4160 domain-containing protein [Chitinophagales bacterium]
MPTVLEVNGYKFKFYSNENDEPPHIHITKGDGNAKYWLVPSCIEEYSYGFKVKERRDIKELVLANRELLIQKWNEYFG